MTISTFLFFFNAPPTTEIYTLSLHDALPIWPGHRRHGSAGQDQRRRLRPARHGATGRVCPTGGRGHPPIAAIRQDREDRKSTRLTPVTVKSRMPSSA